MVVCERCFCDTEVISVIRNKGEIGNCPLCKSKNVHIGVCRAYLLKLRNEKEKVMAKKLKLKIILKEK